MKDRELLRLAAKAAGIEIYAYETRWNPLIADGDALRLAVKLGLLIDTMNARVGRIDGGALEIWLAHEDAWKEDATRRAIVRAAAEIGRQIK